MTGRPQKQDDPQAEERKGPDREEVEEELDKGLDESFPASDPVAIIDPSLPRPPRRKQKMERGGKRAER